MKQLVYDGIDKIETILGIKVYKNMSDISQAVLPFVIYTATGREYPRIENAQKNKNYVEKQKLLLTLYTDSVNPIRSEVFKEQITSFIYGVDSWSTSIRVEVESTTEDTITIGQNTMDLLKFDLSFRYTTEKITSG